MHACKKPGKFFALPPPGTLSAASEAKSAAQESSRLSVSLAESQRKLQQEVRRGSKCAFATLLFYEDIQFTETTPYPSHD